MAAGIRGAKLVKIAGAGHLPNIENPKVFNETLLGFLANLPA
jgi:pimeloyl-ACP methyl ester carboxylesterase